MAWGDYANLIFCYWILIKQIYRVKERSRGNFDLKFGLGDENYYINNDSALSVSIFEIFFNFLKIMNFEIEKILNNS